MRFNFMFGLFLVSIVVLAALLAGVLAPFDPIMDADLMSSELPPGAPHWMGTDAQGRDVLSRILYGARVSLLVDSVSVRDIPVVQGAVLVIVLWFLVINMLVDIAYALIDPRIKVA